VEVLGFEVEVVGWLQFWLEGFCCLALGMWFVVLTEVMLFSELVKVEDDWLWHNGRIGSMPEVDFGKLVVEVKDRMENIASDAEPIAYCGWLLRVRIAVKAV
jgi:hypothetical protein